MQQQNHLRPLAMGKRDHPLADQEATEHQGRGIETRLVLRFGTTCHGEGTSFLPDRPGAGQAGSGEGLGTGE